MDNFYLFLLRASADLSNPGMSSLSTSSQVQNGEMLPHSSKTFYKPSKKKKCITEGHSAGKPFCCSHCSKSFTRSMGLQRHLRIHSMEKAYECSQCPQTFFQLRGLETHMQSHAGKKLHICPQCDKPFFLYMHLRKHLRVHIDEKPFSCEECGKSFSLTNTLKKHMRQHTGEKPFTCIPCSKTFTHACNYKEHLKTKVHIQKMNSSPVLSLQYNPTGQFSSLPPIIIDLSKPFETS